MMQSVRWLLSLAAMAALSISVFAEEPIGYNRSIRPILADNCFACHGPDSAARKADLRIDKREAAIELGAIVPGKPDESELVRRILSSDPDEQMPPPGAHKKLSPEQKALVARWIAQGAEYQPHWSFIAPVRPSVPPVQDLSWPRNPIDNFVLAKLEAAGLRPAPEADRRTLARRVSLDLRGLPPDPSEVEAFVNDTGDGAYQRMLDRMLTSPEWGEHRGRYWLDTARYADTNGIHFDNFRENWAFRDWVIGAFNRNVPFDQFTVEQLAGDLLPNRSLDQLIASGFNRCNMTTNEGGVIAEEYLVLYTRDRTETTSQVWMGMTAGCAVCHDHKFDPLTQREFYSMSAFFNNTTQGAMDGNIKDTPPVIVVPPAKERSAWEELPGKLAAAQQQLDARRAGARGDFDGWLPQAAQPAVQAKIITAGLVVHAPLGASASNALDVSVGGQTRQVSVGNEPTWDAGVTSAKAFKSRPDSNIEVAEAGDFEKDQAFTCSVWVKMPRDGATGAIVARMDNGNEYRGWDMWLDKGRPASHIVHKWPDDAVKVIGKTALKTDKWQYVTLTYDGSGKADGVKIFVDGAPQKVESAANSLKNSIRTNVPLKLAQRNTSDRVDDLAIQDLRIYDRALPQAEITQLASATRAAYLVAKPAEGRTPSEVEELYAWWLEGIDPTYQKLAADQRALKGVEDEIKSRSTVAHVAQEKSDAAMAYILFRGEYDKRRDEVKPETPAMLPAFPNEQPRNRLGFARWLLRDDHPLTARVTVNRFWQEVFGSGLVRTTGEFGVGGELPSHPELLDWLAIEFREGGWDVKQLFRTILMSATYRQNAAVTPDKLEKDPQNRLLSRAPRFRMDAEVVRDYALAASGVLVRKQGGPSVRPYQPEGVWEAVAMIGSNTRDYREDSGDNLYRRSMYTFWKRAAPPASMEIFNAPNREVCTVRRERTNTPLQALVTLNDPQFVEAARHLAQRALQSGDADAGRADFLAQRLLSRPLAPQEWTVVERSLGELVKHYREHGEDAQKLISVGQSKPDASLDVATLAAWTMLTNELMNLDEVLNK
jgi:mono/diheme cytochrome c family protein